ASPGVLNLMGVLSATTGEPLPDIAARFRGRGYGYLKAEVSDAIVERLAPVREEYLRLCDEPAYIDGVLERSAEEARTIARTTIARVRDVVGLG
ncbi:MAG: tryptophan--tRNA ligase, partial [Gemmatimonadetes bacterium]|nr:tryptophan--tRNA ligase [Gemmatimonadota bacterium]